MPFWIKVEDRWNKSRGPRTSKWILGALGSTCLGQEGEASAAGQSGLFVALAAGDGGV